MQLKSYISNHKYKCYLRTVGKGRLSVSNNSSSHKDTLGIRGVVHKSWITAIVVLWCRFVIFWVWHLPFTFTACKWTAGLWSAEDRIITNRFFLYGWTICLELRAEDYIWVLGVFKKNIVTRSSNNYYHFIKRFHLKKKNTVCNLQFDGWKLLRTLIYIYYRPLFKNIS